MKLLNPWFLLLMAAGWPGAASSQLQLLPDKEPQRAFVGDARQIILVWHNRSDKTVNAEIRARLYQTSSTTAVPLTEEPWKNIEILPGQTVLESATVDFPAINAETRFLIQWVGTDNHVIGETGVLVYPTNLMGEL
jgi:hypothetical protein